ncbi:MAG: DUF1549 and DUF1553 domain-containing protein, partial [Planctomycetota bacterium]|nr:DUF1549 and DUF1553 domain-containing protein [Planctomycetota bacterium]
VDSKKRIDLKHARQFWAFRPLRQTVVPGVNSDWPASAVDRFILAKLQARGLTPAPPADRRTLLRRTTMTLTGLPPTPDELDAFAADESPAALAEVVDRLLASPHYGERWGRHWLDVVRYADSNGLDENIHHGTAWRYRDFVIEAFNSDLPFDEFVTEQIAGDLLTSATETERHRRLIATGFLAIGPKVLAEVDETKMEMDIIDEQLDTLGRSMMGLTLGCARCHDHKFDPISAKDYYALAGIFKSTRTMEHYTKIARWWENPIPSAADKSRQADHAKQIAASKSKLATFITAANRKVLDSLPDGAEPPQNLESKYPAATKAELKTLRDAITKLEKNPPEVSTAIGVGERTATDLPVHIRGSHLTLGDVVPRRFPIFLAGDQQTEFGPKQSGRLPLANWLTSEEHPLTSRVIVNRVWRWHFGRGLVDSPDNFGNLGQRPVNQPLLDWLAVEFRRHGWSIKWLHRTILLSSTWRMSSRMDAKASEVDPENRLQWRADIRRLEAEAIRDSILAVTGQLDRTMRGTLITLKNRSFFFDHTSKDTTDYSSNRRSVYLPVVRNHLYEVFSLFDYSDAGSVVGSRTTSVVAPQALFMMNSDFMLQASRSLAKLGTVDGSDDARVNGLYRRVLGRRPTDRELKQSLDFINRSAALGSERDAGWAYLGQVLLSSNEFIYLR